MLSCQCKFKNFEFDFCCRNKHGKMNFLRVEVVLQAATYFIVFTDADTMPPPIRINNFSKVAIQFYQVSLPICFTTFV